MICGLVGENVQNSFSQTLHSMLGDYDYELFSVPPARFESFLMLKGFDALNITIPYKETVLKYCSKLSQNAQAIGSVNTVVKEEDGSLTGYNTDINGFIYEIESSGISVEGKNVLILGSGGTSKTATEACRRLGARTIDIVSRSGELNYSNVYDRTDASIIVNTTPVGMFFDIDGCPVDITRFPALEGVLDAIYSPLCSRLVYNARELGIPAVGGLSMLVAQAYASAEFFGGRSVSEEAVSSVMHDLSNMYGNIVLTGMPGCGKTSVGMRVALILNRSFADVDDIIAKEQGMPAAEVLKKIGEKGFRKLEGDVILRHAPDRSMVIATGGGTVLSEDNMRRLKANGRVVFLERELESLPTEGRPISQARGVEALYNERLPLYKKYADITVNNNSDINHVAKEVIKRIFD